MIQVAVYCRVSTSGENQQNSFEAQQRYFRDYIDRKPDWQLHAVYADEGISGTGTKKRIQFNRMIDDAYRGAFRLIVTKEVSRFSRNIVDTITYTRELKAMGVGVLFVNDGINTLDPDAELRLSIMASIAQEESRKTSSRVVWGQTRQMEKGVVFGPSMLGYDVRDGKITVNPEGARIVQTIFCKYALERAGTAEIARFLRAAGYRTYRGSTEWKAGGVVKILKNEKYVGDLVQKKTYTPDYLTHQKKRNTGQVPLVRIENHHEPIVSREIWNLAQKRLRQNNRHREGNGGHSNRHIFSGKIKCGQCGASFVARYRTGKDGTKIRRWQCGRGGCNVGKLLRDDDGMNMLKVAIQCIPLDKEAITKAVIALIQHGIQAEKAVDDQTIHREMDGILRKKEMLLDSFLDGAISRLDMEAMNRKYDSRMESLQELLGQPKHEHRIDEIKVEIEKLLAFGTESEAFWKQIPEYLAVFQDRHVELKLRGIPWIFRFLE